MTYLLYALGFSVAFNMTMFLIAYLRQTDKLTDISYAATFIALVAYAYLTRENTWEYSWVIALMVIAWALRLGMYLLHRIHKMGRDKRFDDKRASIVRFGGFWLLQAVTVFVVGLGFLLFYGEQQQPDVAAFLVGICIWGIGLVIEAAADMQKFRFISSPKNKDKWIASGLWRYSRHPNYFGEILVWSGLWVAVSSGMSGVARAVSLLSPLFIMAMLLFVSGIPLLEKSADKKWGNNKGYRRYKNATSILIPLPPKKSQ